MSKKKDLPTIENKPLFWSIYGVYCAIPVVIYAWYLWKRAREVLQWLLSYDQSIVETIDVSLVDCSSNKIAYFTISILKIHMNIYRYINICICLLYARLVAINHPLLCIHSFTCRRQ